MTAVEFAREFEPDPWNGGPLLPDRDSTPGLHAFEVAIHLYGLDRETWRLLEAKSRVRAIRGKDRSYYYRLSMPIYGRKISPDFVDRRFKP